jgi:hypothetical protein
MTNGQWPVMIRTETKTTISKNIVNRERWRTKGDKDNNRGVRDGQWERKERERD